MTSIHFKYCYDNKQMQIRQEERNDAGQESAQSFLPAFYKKDDYSMIWVRFLKNKKYLLKELV